MPRLLLVLFLSILVPTLSSCASRGAERAGSSRSAILEADIQRLQVASALDVVSALRPQWLRTRGRSSIAAPESSFPVVFVDHARYGSPESLRQVLATHIESIHFLSAREATTRHGTGYPSGIIQVRTKSNN